MPPADPKDEYLDISNNMRSYSNLRFAQLTLFAAISAGLMSLLFTGPALSLLIQYSLKILGIIITVVFWLVEESSTDRWFHGERQAKKLEEELGFHQYRDGAEHKFKVGATRALRILFVTAGVFWFVMLLFHHRVDPPVATDHAHDAPIVLDHTGK